jgi:uncharacterized membrane protein
MTITLPLKPQEEAKLIALAQERGISAEQLVREAVEKMLITASDELLKPKKSAYGLLEKYGPGPTDQEIAENRKEMFRGFAEESS